MLDELCEYQQVMIDHILSRQQKLQFLPKVLSKDAKQLYLERVANYVQSFQQAVDIANKE